MQDSVRRVDCPISKREASWIELPAEWLGVHARRRDESIEKSDAQSLPPTLRDFALSLSLLEDWSLPGLNGNPEKWDLDAIPLEIIVWVNDTVLRDFARCWNFPKD